MNTTIPYSDRVRPDTGFSNGGVGIFLFLASEVMFFGALIASYTLLRLSAPEWHFHLDGVVSETIVLTALLALASSAISMASRRKGSDVRSRLFLFGATLMGIAFVCAKVHSLAVLWDGGLVPASSTAAALFFCFAAVHLLHVAGGTVWGGLLALQREATDRADVVRTRARRARLLLAYWTFVDIVWLVIIVFFYVS